MEEEDVVFKENSSAAYSTEEDGVGLSAQNYQV
jgi:hypothetical protein